MQRQDASEQWDATADDLSEGASYIDAHLKFLENPDVLYLQSPDEVGRRLNQLIFARVFAVNDEVLSDELNSPVAELLEAERPLTCRSLSASDVAEESKRPSDAATASRHHLCWLVCNRNSIAVSLSRWI